MAATPSGQTGLAHARQVSGRVSGTGSSFTLASAQFLMTLDTSVMNVGDRDGGEGRRDTTVTGIQTAITLYTLVMAA